jgi:hypothetical protein
VTTVATASRLGEPVGAPAGRGSMQELFPPGGPTLEDAVLGAWDDLARGGEAECPVCRGRLQADGCDGCGAELA